MNWWQSAHFSGDLTEGLSHANEAIDARKEGSATRVCELYFHALNKFWNSFAQHEGTPGRADTPSFVALLGGMT